MKWSHLPTRNGTGRLVYYYSNQDASLPIRDIQKSWDEKADPNIETMTYGLFSTCTPPGRKNAFEQGDEFLFFCTNWQGQRMITGYYEIYAYVSTGFVNRGRHVTYHFPDYAFLARKARFISPGLNLGDHGQTWWERVKVQATGITGYGLRTAQQVTAKEASLLLKMLNEQKDRTTEYIDEIRRLESENLRKFGVRYPTFQQGKATKRLLSSGFNSSIMDNFVVGSSR